MAKAGQQLDRAVSSLPEIQTSTIAIVGISCVVLIIVLSSVLAYFCCKRPKIYKEMNQSDALGRQSASAPVQYQVSDGKPYALVPPHQSFSADDIAGVAASASSCKKPLMAASQSESSRRSSVQFKEETAVDVGVSALQQEQRRSSATVVFATLRSGHNPLDSSASNPMLFSYPQDNINYRDDNRNTDPYTFDGTYGVRQKKIVYEVVV